MRFISLKLVMVVLFALATIFTACGEGSNGTDFPEREEASDNSAKESKKDSAEDLEDDIVEKDEGKATITFTVVDVFTKLPLQNTKVYYRTTDKAKYTDSAGTSVWKGFGVGECYFDFQVEGYAMKRFVVNVEAGVTNLQSRIDLYPLGIDIMGTVMYEDAETGKELPVTNNTVYIKYEDDEIYPNEVYAYIGENGSYRLSNLARGVNIAVYVSGFVIDEMTYEVTFIGSVYEQGRQSGNVIKDMDTTVVHAVGADSSSSSSGKTDVCGSIPAAGCDFKKEDNVWKFRYAGSNYIHIYTWVDETTVEYRECMNSYHMDLDDSTYTGVTRDEMFTQAMEECSFTL